MKRKMLSVLLCAAMMGTTLAGATSVLAADDKDSDSKWEYKEATLTFLIDPDTASAGYQAVFDLCEKETGIHIETELRASGGDGDNQVKTRLASGEMTDLCGYNSGAKLNELDPESNFIDISGEEWASRLDDTFASAVSAGSDSAVYGVPLTATNLGCILYNKDLYEQYDLEVPDTWEDFLKNCDTLKDAGETAVIGSLGDSWTIVTIEECQDKIRCLTQQRDYARTHQKIVEIPVEKPVLYKKCEACDRTAYQNEKAKYETQKERLAGQYKAKTVIFQTTLFLLAWYSLTTTLFQAVQSDMFLVDCKSFFNDLASFIQTFVGWTIDAGHSAAQISTKIPNAFIAGMVYWLLLILIVGICMAGTGMLAILIEIKVIELYKKNCWDVITLLMILTSVAIVIYFGESIKKVLSVNLLLLFVLSQGAYVGIRCYLKVWLEKRPY